MKERTKHLTELLKKSTRAKFRIPTELFHERCPLSKELKEHIEALEKDPKLEVIVIRVIDNINITVELKE